MKPESRDERRGSASGPPEVLTEATFIDDSARAYVAREELGRGVLTSVRCAGLRDDPQAEEAPLAIKTILPLWIGHPLAEARIAREREVSHAIFSDATDPIPCARVLGGGRQLTTDGRSRPFHVSRRLAGHTLAEHLRDPPPVDREALRTALAWIDDVLLALGRVHAAGWVHRDLKPQNVFVTHPPGADAASRPRAYLLDFGLAVRIGAQRAEFDEPFGTPAYVSPEVIAGARIDARADLYSLGLLLFHLVAGRRAFHGDPVAVLEAHLSEPAPRLRAFYPDCPAELDRVVAATLAKAPGERPSSVAELRALLAGVKERSGSLPARPRIA